MPSIPRLLIAIILSAGCAVASVPEAPAPANADAAETEVEAPPMPEKVARVGDSVITGDAFLRYLHQRLIRTRMARGADYQPDAGFQRRALLEMIESEILQKLADASGLTVDETDVLRELDRGKAGFNSEEAYAEYLNAMGMDESQLKEEIRERLLREAYVDRETADITLGEDELREQYEKVREQGGVYRQTKTIDFVHIFIRARGTDIADWGDARERIDAIRERIMAGESMEDLARDFSEDLQSASRGGMYYEARKEDAPAPLVDELFSLPLDEVSEPLRSETGWHLVKVVAIHNPGTVSFEQLRPMLEHGLRKAKRAVRVTQLVTEAREDIPVEIYTADGEPVPLPLPEDASAEVPEESEGGSAE